jgi:hypothetical protein
MQEWCKQCFVVRIAKVILSLIYSAAPWAISK